MNLINIKKSNNIFIITLLFLGLNLPVTAIEEFMPPVPEDGMEQNVPENNDINDKNSDNQSEKKESTKKKSGCKNTLSLFSIFTVFGLVIVFRKKQ